MDTETHFGNWKVVFSPLAALFSCSYKRSNFTTGTLYNGDIVHWTLEVDQTFRKVVQKNSIHLARWNPAVKVVHVLKCQPNHVHVLESVVQTLGHFHSVFSGEASLGRKGRLYYKAEFSTLWVNVKYYMKPAKVSFKFKNIDTYVKPASTNFTLEIWQHLPWMRNSI